MHENLTRAVEGNPVQGRIDLVGHTMAAVDAGQAQQAAHDVGLFLAGDGDDGHTFVFHGAEATSASAVPGLVSLRGVGA